MRRSQAEQDYEEVHLFRSGCAVIYTASEGCQNMSTKILRKVQLRRAEELDVLNVMRPIYATRSGERWLYGGDDPREEEAHPLRQYLADIMQDILLLLNSDVSYYTITDRIIEHVRSRAEEGADPEALALDFVSNVSSLEDVREALFPSMKAQFLGILDASQPRQPYSNIGFLQLSVVVEGQADVYIRSDELEKQSLEPGSPLYWPTYQPRPPLRSIGFILSIVQRGTDDLPWRLRIYVTPGSCCPSRG